MFYLLLYRKYQKDCLTQRRHLINICWLNTQNKCITGQNQPPWTRSPPSEARFEENSEWREICTKEFLNPKWFHSVYFKDPSNDAHQAITALQIAFFSTQFIYKRLGNEAILEISHLGGRRRMAPVSIWSNYILQSRGERRQCNEEALSLEGRLFSLSFLSPGFASVSSWNPWQPICRCIVSQASLDSLPQCWGDRIARSSAGDASLKCQVFCFRQSGAFMKGHIPSDLSLPRSLFFLVTEKRDWSERLCIFRN